MAQHERTQEIGITIVTEDTRKQHIFSSACHWFSRRGMRSPSKILCSLSNTPSQLFPFSYLQYLTLAWWAENNNIM